MGRYDGSAPMTGPSSRELRRSSGGPSGQALAAHREQVSGSHEDAERLRGRDRSPALAAPHHRRAERSGGYVHRAHDSHARAGHGGHGGRREGLVVVIAPRKRIWLRPLLERVG
jgi:hypothetical protein